ncbi:MAG: hypothetical protein IJX25_04705 [Clostridia bacterium]|nr:hypothetical protein [Clostridia bacterium]MBQ8792129.1 hypothetical protein [Clostridia bacterium]
MTNLIKINNDVYFICKRLKKIDPSYEVYYNRQTCCYEVHSNKQAKNSYCFKVPFAQLDSRTIDYAIKTRRENRDKLLKEIEQSNQLLYERNLKEQVNLLKEII